MGSAVKIYSIPMSNVSGKIDLDYAADIFLKMKK